jgi:acyl carrier protein
MAQGETETVLAEIWSEVLKVEQIGRDDNFFELGGQSLQGMELLDKVAQRLTVQLPFFTIFQCPTIREMAERVESGSDDDV